MPVRRPLLPKLLLATFTTLLASGIAWWLWSLRAQRSTVELTSSEQDGPAWNGDSAYVVDAAAGFRPRRSSVSRTPMLALDDSDVQMVEKHRDRNALLRATDLPEKSPLPRVLVLGDSHVDGVVSTADNFTSRLEAASATTAHPYLVLNAGCGLYSLWQHVLRARDLLGRFHPQVVVVVVFLGNDFLDLDNPTVPHLDDALAERPGGKLDRPETTSARQSELALRDPNGQLFWQGLNQALYLLREPARRDVLVQKSRHAVEVMERAAEAADAEVVWVLLPSFDLVFPDHTAGLGKVTAEVVQAGVQRTMRDAFAGVLTARGARVLDMEPLFAKDGSLALYAKDFHIYRRAHRLLADALAPLLAALLP